MAHNSGERERERESLTGRETFEEGCAIRVGDKIPRIEWARGARALVPDRGRCVAFASSRLEKSKGKRAEFLPSLPPLVSCCFLTRRRGELPWSSLVSPFAPPAFLFGRKALGLVGELAVVLLMAVGGSFDQWQKDAFFSAAEAVQESADIMESTYRMWTRNRRNGFGLEASDELSRELQTALGTAKWQLEEFEKALRASHGNYSSQENNTINRHRQFVAAIRNQILLVEKQLNHSLVIEGKSPLRWVQLNDDERDDLAVFLSGVPHKFQQPKHKNADPGKTELARSFKDVVTINKGKGCVEEFTAKEPYKSKVDEVHAKVVQLNGPTGALSSPDIGAWKIVIANEDTDKGSTEVRPETLNHGSSQSGILGSVESTSKLKSFKNNPWNAKTEELLPLRNGLSYYLDSKGVRWFAQGINGLTERSKNCFSHGSKLTHSQHLPGKVGGFQRNILGSQHRMHFAHSLRIAFLLTLSIILVEIARMLEDTKIYQSHHLQYSPGLHFLLKPNLPSKDLAYWINDYFKM
ncbi:syntaxin 6, N-terminal domain containing protein, partial [Musa troglodytarum]